MEKLPTESSYSFRKGIWFVFKDGQNYIRLWGSNLNGKERFYYNDVLLSEKKNMTKLSGRYEHENDQNDTYVVAFKMTSLRKGKTEWNFYKNDQLEQRIQFGTNKEFTKGMRKIMYVSLIVFLTMTIIIKVQNLSAWWYLFPAILFVLLNYLLIRKTGILELVDTTEFIDEEI